MGFNCTCLPLLQDMLEGFAGYDESSRSRIELWLEDIMAEPPLGSMASPYLLSLRLDPQLMKEHVILQRFHNWLEGRNWPGTEPVSSAVTEAPAVKRLGRERLKECWGEEAGEYVTSVPRLDLEQACIIREGRQIPLTPVENNIMTLLYQARGRVVTHRFFEEWAYQADSCACFEPKHHIRQLRSKLGDDLRKPVLITNRRGIGYSLSTLVKAVTDRSN